MKHLLRPYRISHRNIGSITLGIAAAGLLLASHMAQAQALARIFSNPNPFVAHASTGGYLGVDVSDVDADKAQALKLKEVRGALITLIDHDAPAGQIGLKVNDVVLAVNGQNVEGAEQLRRMLHEIPAGRKISLEISRDGNIQTLAVQLVDRKAMEQSIWSRIGMDADGVAPAPPAPVMGIMGGGDAPLPPSGFHSYLFTSTLNVGALVEPLTSQMADYLGVQGGLMVKQVGKKSEAAAAGFKAFDVILKVGADTITTSADWDRALRSNQGKPVQVTVLRDKKQQTLTLQVDSKHRSALEFNKEFDNDFDDLFADGDAPLLAELTPGFDADKLQALTAQVQAEANAAAAQARQQADTMRKQMENMPLQVSPGQMNPEQIEQLRQQAERLRENIKNFQMDPKQMQQLQQQMEQFRKSFSDEQMKQLQQQMERFKQQIEQWSEQGDGHFV
ncbi:MAG: PDZ domain-containing protein [Terracidiphilus sp.]|jgi:membrane-associated protease RseP (regulator of RpoE activity)